MLELSKFTVTVPPVDPTECAREAAWPNATKELTWAVFALMEVKLGPKTTAFSIPVAPTERAPNTTVPVAPAHTLEAAPIEIAKQEFVPQTPANPPIVIAEIEQLAEALPTAIAKSRGATA